MSFYFYTNGSEITGTGYTPDGTIPKGCLACTEAQAANWQQYAVSNGAIVANPNAAAVKQAADWAAYQSSAQAALAASDKTIIRCVENGVAVPSAWAQYRAALRAIVGAKTGTPGTLPTRPAFPAGT